METLQWTYLLGLLSIQAAPSHSENPMVSQSPRAISLIKVNSTAEIRCSSTLSSLVGLSFVRRFSRDEQVLYLSMQDMKQSVKYGYEHKIFVTGKCCDFTIHMSQLMVDDTDAYYCKWTHFDSKSMKRIPHQSNETIIIVRERDPRDDCSQNNTIKAIFFILGLSLSVVIVNIFIGVVVWYWTRIKVYRLARVQQHRRRLCPLHSGQQHICRS